MDKDKKERETRAKRVYASPRVEMYAADPSRLMNISGQHYIGGDDGEVNGAKELHLDISFSDPWEE